MKKFKKVAYIILIVVIVVLSLTIYTNASKNNEVDEKNKTNAEIEFIESKLVDLLNSMNNIEFENYSISTSEVTSEDSQSNSEGSDSNKEGSSGNGGESSSGEENGSGTESVSNASVTKENTKKFNLNQSGVLLNSEDINWDNIKSEIEVMYASLPTITLDLYQLNLNQEDVLGFNKEFDNLTLAAKNEDKVTVLKELSILYEYVPKFVKNASDSEIEKTSIETKSNIFKAYSKLDDGNWEEISNDVNNAVNTYSKLLTQANSDPQKQYSINKAYIMLNELQNAVKLNDASVFLIKYKNLLEQLNNL